MGLVSSLVQIEKKFAWSFLGFVLAAIFGFLALYTEFFRDTSPVLTYEIVSNTRVFDVREDVKELSILYNNEDIRKSKKTLSVLIIRVINTGRSPVLKNSYDTAARMGLIVQNGEMIKGEIASASSEYLIQNAKMSFASPNVAEFSEVIIEPKEFYDVKFLILSPDDKPLALSSKGKIAGVKQITIVDQASRRDTDSFWRRVASGSILVQITRVPVYLLGFIMAIFCIFAPIAIITEYFEKRKRRKVVKQFDIYSESKFKTTNEKVYEFYVEKGLYALLKMKKAVADEEKFEKFKQTCTKQGVDLEEPQDELPDPSMLIAMGTPPHERRRNDVAAIILKRLLELGLVTKEGDELARNQELIKSFTEFVDFAAIKEA